jgi:hypothetical protein
MSGWAIPVLIGFFEDLENIKKAINSIGWEQEYH